MDSPNRTLNLIGDAFESAPCGLATTTVEGTIVRVNATFCRWLGFSPGQLLERRRIQDLLTVGGKVFHQTHWAPLLQMQRSVAEVKLDVRRSDGGKIPMLVNATRRWDGETEYDDFAFVIVTDRNKYEQELLRARKNAEVALEEKNAAEQALQLADRRKDEFLATLAHELRNPLAPIQSVVELLRQKDFSDPQVRWSRDVLARQVGQLARLVDDLLEVSRVAEGKLELRKERVDLATVIEQAIEGSRALIDASSHDLTTTLPIIPVFVDADPARLVQIIQNLINNAAKYTPERGAIQVKAECDRIEAIVSVRDSGIGIAAEHLPSIFGIFAQLPPGLSRSQGGLGIGLSLVRALTERHGGTVSATSAGVGMGSEFTVRLPLSAQQAPAGTDEASSSGVEARGLRILIVDDSEDASMSLSMLLEMEGYRVQTAATGQTGLQAVMDFAPDAVVLDIGLPDMTGYEIAKQIRKRVDNPNLLLVALTGWGQARDKEDAAEAGFDFHFTKPVAFRQLLEVLRRLGT